MKNPPPTVRHFTSPLISGMITAATIIGAAGFCNAAFIIEASDASGRLGEGNFSYTGSVGVPSYSTASSGQLPATTDLPQTFFTLRHAFGGSGSADEYTFSYTPSADGDNTSFAAGTLFNSLGASPDLVSTGLSGGIAGIYNVYRIHPGTPGVSGGLTTYQVFVNGLELAGLGQSIDQNAADILTGANIGRWELIGSVPVPNATDTVTVTMTPDTSSFVSMRASGIMFEYVEAIPEPNAAALLGLGGLALLYRRRVRA